MDENVPSETQETSKKLHICRRCSSSHHHIQLVHNPIIMASSNSDDSATEIFSALDKALSDGSKDTGYEIRLSSTSQPGEGGHCNLVMYTSESGDIQIPFDTTVRRLHLNVVDRHDAEQILTIFARTAATQLKDFVAGTEESWKEIKIGSEDDMQVLSWDRPRRFTQSDGAEEMKVGWELIVCLTVPPGKQEWVTAQEHCGST